jgi:uncharacterized membrane protein (DUF2068 family)
LIPIWYTLVDAIYNKDANVFAYPVLVALIYLVMGFYAHAWHPGWVVFLSIPIYYYCVSYIQSLMRSKKTGKDDDIIDV